MPTDIDQLKTVKSQLLARLAEVTASTQPTYSIDGQSVSRTEYMSALQERMEKINELIQVEEPFWYTSTTL